MNLASDNSYSSTVTPTYYFFFFTFTETSIGKDAVLKGFHLKGTWAFGPEGTQLVLTSSLDNETTNLDLRVLNSSRLILRFSETQFADLKGNGEENEVAVEIEFVLSRVLE